MRLTLATLLAYLDNVLEPADSQVLSEKIEKSDFASGLVMRIKSITRKLRMSAPKVEGKGLGRDPNSVAEYLDGSLAPERLGDFERQCLESDVQLAEVASCHQVLAMVLNKPAEVPPHLRERIYDLGKKADAARVGGASRVDAPHGTGSEPPLPPKPSSAATSASMLAIPSDNGKSTEPEAPPVANEPAVPDYLRAAQGNGAWRLIAALAAVFLIALGILRLLGPFDSTHPLARAMGLSKTVAEVPQPEPNPNPISQPMPSVPQPAEVPQPNPQPMNPPAAVEPMPMPVEPMPMPVEPMPMPLEPKPPVEVPAVQPEAPPAQLPLDPANPLIPAKPIEPAKPGDAPPMELAAVTPKPAEPKPLEPKPLEPMPLAPNPLEPKPAEPMPLPVPPAVPVNPSATVDLGRYTSDEQVIARLVNDPEMRTKLWYRLAPRSMLNAGERLVVLPSFRPQLTLANGIQATIVGESSLKAEVPAQAGNSRLVIDYGRIWLASLGAAGGQVELDLAGLKGVVALADADAAVAIDVRWYLPPGVAAHDPKAELVRVVDVFSTGGRVIWHVDGEQPIEIAPQHVAVYVAQELPRLGGPFEAPAWTDAKSLPDIERRASTDLEAELPLDSSLDLKLAEHAQGRKIEVRSLAARCLCALDQFEAILSEINDPRQYSYWATDIDSLRFALARSPASANRALATLQNQRPENAKLIYDMLLGASDEQLLGGSAATLVKALESNETDVRVVALDSLRRITNSMLMYRPEKPLASNATSIQKWKEKLKDNLITNRLLPSPLNEYKPAEEK